MWNAIDAISFRKDVAIPRNACHGPQTLPKHRPLQRHPRILFSVPITLQYLGDRGVRTCHGVSLDISESGVGALVDHVLPIGDNVGLEMQLPERQLNSVAIVRHSSSLRSGFEFVGLTLEERTHLNNVVGSV